MFAIGDTVVYGAEGVCNIAELQMIKAGGKKANYYVLRPINRPTSTIFVPTDNELLISKMRNVLEREQIDELLIRIKEEAFEWIEDSAERKARFLEIISSGNRGDTVKMIRALYHKREELRGTGKRLRSSDEQLLHDAEKLVCDEFAYSLQIPKNDVPNFIKQRLENA